MVPNVVCVRLESLGIAMGQGIRAWQVGFWDPVAIGLLIGILMDLGLQQQQQQRKLRISNSIERDFGVQHNLLNLALT